MTIGLSVPMPLRESKQNGKVGVLLPWRISVHIFYYFFRSFPVFSPPFDPAFSPSLSLFRLLRACPKSVAGGSGSWSEPTLPQWHWNALRLTQINVPTATRSAAMTELRVPWWTNPTSPARKAAATSVGRNDKGKSIKRNVDWTVLLIPSELYLSRVYNWLDPLRYMASDGRRASRGGHGPVSVAGNRVSTGLGLFDHCVPVDNKTRLK